VLQVNVTDRPAGCVMQLNETDKLVTVLRLLMTDFETEQQAVDNYDHHQVCLGGRIASFCKQNLLLFIQPRWQLRRTYFFNRYNVLF